MQRMDRSAPPIQRVNTINRPVPASRQMQRASPVTRPTISSMQKFGTSSASKELKDILERKIEDLSRQLAEERQSARQSKMAVARLQREITRSKSHERHHGKEQLSKELENEKMYRVEAERRLQEMTRESENCHSRLECLQGEFKKMEGMVHEMIQYKSKIDQLKQEKSSLSTTYEANIDKFKSHITGLERENMMLLNEVKKLESQMSHKTDGRDRYKLLLERLRMVEGENSSLVLENEQQRGQYEKCLDEIANQVVQALLAQKMLREECLKLQDRVQDLEHHNRQLCTAFQQRIKLMAEGNAQTADNLAGIPQMSSPPLWLKERLPGDRQSIVSFSGSITSTPDVDFDLSPEPGEFRCRTEIQTEFPATPSSPKSKHVSFVERKSETKRSSSTSSLVTPKCGPSRQRTRSTSSLSRARGLSLISPQTVSKSHESGIQNTATNEQSGLNQGVAVSANQKSSKKTSTNPNCITKIRVPLNQSHPSIANNSSQGQMSQSSSKIPTLPSGKTKDDVQVRRNSLKAEYSIRMGCQSPAARNSPSPNPNSKPPQPRTSSHGSRSSSVSSGGQGHSRSPSATSGRSQSSGSKIPTVSKISVQSTSKSSSASTGSKQKTGNDKQTTGALTKLVPPKSPNLRYSGIRTTLKTDNKTVQKSETSGANNKTNTTVSQSSTSANLKTVYSISPITSSKISDAKKSETKKPAIPVHGNKPVNHRAESHFPIMGLTTLNQTSPKNDETSNVYANVSQVPSTFSSVLTRTEQVHQNGDQTDSNTLTRGQYFYDYSDEDSDFREADLKRPVSTDFSAASTISLDELLDRTLENTGTPVDSDFSSGFFLYPPQKVTENKPGANICGVSNSENVNQHTNFTKSDNSEKLFNSQNNAEFTEKEIETKNRLMGKPDIVQDTEECEQRLMQQSLTLSEIPGSSMPGYRAKRPKSLILGAKEKKFLYCEYGSSSSSDTSDEERRYKVSYAKNVKQQEIQSMVAKSVKAGEAKVIESPKSSGSNKDSNLNKSKTDSSDTKKTKTSQLPKPGVVKKPSRIPPPVASKPSHKVSVDPKADARIPRPKSVEICVNTAALSSINSKTCYPFLHDAGSTDFSKSESETCLIKNYDKSENSEMMSTTTFDDVKVERSGSKDDGYSTMSSDIQPENLEKYSDAFESSTNSNEARNSNLSLSSQNSYSSEDRLSGHGSLGRVKAMKMKFEIENQKSPESSPTKSPPVSPKRSLLKSPKSLPDRPTTKQLENSASEASTNASQMSKIPKPKGTQISQIKPKSAIPLPKTSSTSAKKDHVITKVEVNIQPPQKKITKETVEQVTVQSHAVESSSFSVKSSPIVTVPQNAINTQKFLINKSSNQSYTQQNSMTKKVVEEFNQLTYFPPAFDKMEILVEGYDSNSSLSDRGSDLTSLHISEDNILSDIPEEKDGYESSVGIRSENTSVSSLPAINVKKQSQQMTHTVHSHHASAKFQFSTTLKRHWSSYQGLVRAVWNSDYEKQKRARQTADYEELYGGCLNIETLLERSSSESDMFTRGDKPEVILLPRLPRSKSADHLVIDEMAVEEQLQAMLKHSMLQQISKDVESADKDGDTFSSFVELLVQRGHVLDSPSPLKEVKNIGLETPTALNKMTVSNFSSKGQNSSPNSFVSEERPETELPPIWEDQKKFNSQFYSLCNTGSSRSISEKSENPNIENLGNGSKNNENKNIIHTCQQGDKNCKKCEEERNVNEFDNISRQIESLSKTVNQLHRSLSSLNSENSDSGSESNEGDVGLSSAIGNKDIDGYQWVEDEFFLSPYGGEIILGSSPFSKTGASCDWINDYSENVEQIEEIGGEEALLDEPDIDIQLSFDKNSAKNKRNSMQKSIIADSLDEEGNFDSHHFISQRLQQEEERRKGRTQDSTNSGMNITMPELMKLESTMNEVLRSRPLLKEDLRMTPEKDTDDTEKHYDKKQTDMFEKMMLYGGSQDSLDDNIGVDNVMCHRLLGGKGQNVVNKTNQTVRPPLEFSNSQFVRYDDPEIQAMAAFDFLNEMTSSHTSDQSNEQKPSHDQLFRREERRYVSYGYQNQMNQSTTSNESRISPVKRPRRKLRQRVRKDPKVDNYNHGYIKTRKFSSTSADESNDEDISLSDSFCDSCSSDEGVNDNGKQLQRPSKKMTYL
ncbi:serine-rich adhesin for platelets-like isoform X2 [Mercenaria mercenaria]|uniref:serine-rich adhesin for platelets-like isoform X2 n=1 Tax=Mercenaria mercenaria TaxID=6596 RepID=UPI00234E8C3E|nr:serine-rich adhesin for platelets-like isoform X2 [Mercenaria mercenaria]